MRRLRAVSDLRPKRVIDHILKSGFVTTEELREVYGYNHPPRAARDVRERGIPLETFRIRDSQGRSIGAYRFGDPEEGEAPGQFIAPHGVGVDSHGDIYVGEVSYTIFGSKQDPPREVRSLSKLRKVA